MSSATHPLRELLDDDLERMQEAFLRGGRASARLMTQPRVIQPRGAVGSDDGLVDGSPSQAESSTDRHVDVAVDGKNNVDLQRDSAPIEHPDVVVRDIQEHEVRRGNVRNPTWRPDLFKIAKQLPPSALKGKKQSRSLFAQQFDSIISPSNDKAELPPPDSPKGGISPQRNTYSAAEDMVKGVDHNHRII